jgi:UDP-glucose:(heptosyl)LPS alpha-1,3-glucosyltransferase
VKIGLILERFDQDRGGLEHWTWQFARKLLARKHEVHVVAFEFHPEAAAMDIVAHRLPMPRSRIERAEALAAYLRNLHLDVVHDMGIGWHADIIQPHAGSVKALWEHNLMRIPKWRQIRFWRERRYRELEEIEARQHANSSAIIVALSRMLQRNFETYNNLPASRMRVIYNGVDVDRFTPDSRARWREATRRDLGIAEHEVMFLMLAHNLLLKNAETVIRATAKLVAEGSPVRTVIGGGKKPERFVELAKKLGASRAVSFLGLVDSRPHYAAADVYVQPTWYDPCSLVTLEASACGLPVITSRYNGASEMMTNGKEGFVLDQPGDVDGLATYMRELLDPRRREEMGAAGRALMLAHTFEHQTNEFCQLYDEVVAAKR